MCDALRAAGLAPMFAEKTGLVLDAYFSGTKVRWLLDHVDGARARAQRGELAFGTIDSWLVWQLTGGARALHGREQREPHAALQHPDRRLGRRPPARARRAARGAAERRRVVRRLRGGADRRRARAHRGHRRRPAGGALRAGVPVAGTGEEHLRHRVLPAHEHRRQGRRVAQQPADDRRVAARRRARLRARRQRVHRRRGRAVAARRPADHPQRRRDRGARRDASPTTAACTSCPRSRGWARRTGTPTRAGR